MLQKNGSGQSWEQAADHFQQAVALRPNDPWAHERLAYVLLNQQRYAEAIDHYAHTIALAYNGVAPAGIYCTLGIAKSLFEYLPAADLSGFENLTGLDPTSLFEYSGSKERNQQVDEASQNFQRCAELATTAEQRARAEEMLKGLK